MPTRVCIVEPFGHPAPAALGQRLPEYGDWETRTVNSVPEELNRNEVLVLNSIPSAPDSIPEQRVLQFVNEGGGLYAIHDTIYPYAANREFIAACGIRAAFDVVQPIQTPTGILYQVLLARADPNDPVQNFPVRPMAGSAGHPILEGVGEFELAEEIWAQNLATGVRALLSAHVGDRIPSHPRFHQAIPVCGCKTLGQGRLAFFSLGHFPEMYRNANFLRLSANALRWVNKQTDESQYAYDLFLSFSSRNRDQARQIYDHAIGIGLRVFMDERDLQPGAEWNEIIRAALVGSRELGACPSNARRA
jgi:hypothetical protein